MLDSEQIFKQIPKHITQWTPEDVSKWFKINEIQIDENVKLSGNQFLKLTPTKMLRQLRLSSFLTRKISEWIQFETSEFEEYVNSANGKTQNPKHFAIMSNQFTEAQEDQQEEAQKEDLKDDNEQKFRSIEEVEIRETSLKKDKKNQLSYEVEDNSTENYKPSKYKPCKQSDKKAIKKINSENVLKHAQSIKQKPFFTSNQNRKEFKNVLVLKSLVQNNAQNSDDVQTCQHIPESSQYFDSQRFPNRIITRNNSYPSDLMQKNQLLAQGEISYQNQVKFITSHLLIPEHPTLIAFVNNQMIQISKTMKVGRSTANQIVLRKDGVSRSHGEIIVQDQQGQGGKKMRKFFLRDLGSRFGTFVEIDPEKPIRVSQYDHYCIGQTTIRVDKLKLNKSREKFDLTISILVTQQYSLSFTGKSCVTLGNKRHQPKQNQITKRINNKQKRDVELEDSQIKNYHCRFTIIQKQVFFQQVEGNIMQKIQKGVMFELVRNHYVVRFGDQNVELKVQNLGYRPLEKDFQDN